MDPLKLSKLYDSAHNFMRTIDGLQPHEALAELVKYLFVRHRLDDAEYGQYARMTESERGGYLRARIDLLPHAEGEAGALKRGWAGASFVLTDGALHAVDKLLLPVNFGRLDFDTHSTAIRRFIAPEGRRGLGIFLTPDSVVRAAVEIAAPNPGSVIWDPACGSGTFLIEVLRFWNGAKAKKSSQIIGSDINANLLLLAELNLAVRSGDTRHVLGQWDFLAGRGSGAAAIPNEGTVDYIFTNPPFGAYVELNSETQARFQTAKISSARASKKISSEVLFFEQCLRYLRPGGMLIIVVPRSMITNDSLLDSRRALDALGEVEGLMNLPPETFAVTGTQANTSVIFLKKNAKSPQVGIKTIPIADLINVGYDNTGRTRTGGQLNIASKELRLALAGNGVKDAQLVRSVTVDRAASLSALKGTSIITAEPGGTRLGDLIQLAGTGRTPPRAKYTDSGVFLLKVGNLTGSGIDWMPRERNYVSAAGRFSEAILIHENDIVMTSSAHHPKYIAQKIDIVANIPNYAGKQVSFVGEVLRLRVKPGAIDPFELVAILRMPTVRHLIQQMISGQTAHLRPNDLLNLVLPTTRASKDYVDAVKRETELAAEMNIVRRIQAQHQVLKAVGYPDLNEELVERSLSLF